ncbi:hypothetical protein [Deinococcus aerophilus]|uniref:Uncharacterized protein n=1 Tax=Deinococcus aerophilus TaxID=522488 RepID=A0ABQ2GSR7_9DEIO|nr:hypothetical protein [Deinococcus aerophilus]GGM09667.1 hypothetical protein GCM10010841_17610 [Deinococcus aerophilus]
MSLLSCTAPRPPGAVTRFLRRAVLGLGLLVCSGASASGASAATLTLQAGQSALVGDTRVTLLRVNDSRCPPRAQCIVAGNVAARIFVVRGSSARLYTVLLPGPTVQTAAGALRLSAATGPQEDRRPPRLTFTVKR